MFLPSLGPQQPVTATSPTKSQFDMEEKIQQKDVQKYFRGQKAENGLQNLVVREFEPADKQEVQQLFHDGMMEMVADTAFRGLRHHPESLLLYAAMTDSRLWVAVLRGKVVGIVAAVGQQKPGGAVELRWMSVDRSCRRCGIGLALGRKVVEFAVAHKYRSVVLGTTSYTSPAHQLYRRLGFRLVGFTDGYVTPGVRRGLPEGIFYRVRHHHYKLDVQR
ncbi:N-acetylaspartate synthetase-like isoform X2 [Gasterosteus aculeatus]